MALELKDVRTKVCVDAHTVLKSLAQARGCDVWEIAQEILEEAALGRLHTVRLAARRLAHAGLLGTEDEPSGKVGAGRR